MSNCCPPEPAKPGQSCEQATPASCCSPVSPAPGHDESCCAPVGQSRRDYLLWGGLALVLAFYLLSVLPAALPLWLQTGADTVRELVHTMWWGVVLAALFVGLLARIPQELILGVLGRPGSRRGVVRATAAGLLLDLCSHGVLMVGMQLYRRGASLGQVMAFLIATPWNSLSLTIIMATLIGLPWTLAFIGLSLALALTTGLLMDRLVARGRLPANPNHRELAQGYQWWPHVQESMAAVQWRWPLLPAVLWDGIRGSAMVIRWLLVGILLTALVRMTMDADLFGHWFGPSLLGLLATLLAATVIEVCSEGSTPLAAELMNRGGAPGNAFTFMMAGVSTDYTEIMSIRDTTGSWRLALALPLYTLPQILLLGWLLNQAV